MTDVSILGLGPIGAALARAVRNHRITVWNRTSQRAEELRTHAAIAPTAAAAVAASPVVITCVTDYSATYSVLAEADLAGKVWVQLATGTPHDAREAAAWAAARGADYLDGAIIAVPSQLGRPESTIFVSGSESAFAKTGPVLREMAGTVPFVGASPGAAAALDFAFLSHLFGGLAGFYHGARICEVEGLSVATFGQLLFDSAAAIGAIVKHDADRIHASDFASPQSSLAICAAALDMITRHARASRLDDSVPAFLAQLFDRGRTAGLSDQSAAVLVKLLRGVP